MNIFNKSIFAAVLFLLTSVSVSSTEIKIVSFFTDPINLHYKGVLPDKALLKIIGSSRENIYLALYDFDDTEIAGSLVESYRRGVDVRLVTDSDNIFSESVKMLVREGIDVVSDNRSGLMHNKFILCDNTYVWTGSYNVTVNGKKRNNNNAILISSPDLYAIYLDEFNEMFEYHIFGNKKDTSLGMIKNKHYVSNGNTIINVFFSPDDDIEKNIAKKIDKAKKSIHFMAFSFTSDLIGEKMIEASKRGVMISGIFETYGSESEYSEYTKMKVEGIAVRKDPNPAYLHHKVIIIDDEWVITGSYNFSKNAQNVNDENSIFIKDTGIAASYFEEFNRLYNRSR